MSKNIMICSNATSSMRLNESESSKERYILTGCFAEIGVLNRNNRIYPKEEYLKHLQYLREDIKKGEPLLGELDHPDDRFEVKLKEASHRVIDLWFDEAENKVMGKIELLSTPNGEIAKRMVDDGVPLHISSRAAGTVNPNNKTVSIQQIYTYDLVAKPGFAGAVLHRVNESVSDKYSDETMSALRKFESSENNNQAQMLGILNEDVCAIEMKGAASLRKEALAILKENNDIAINMKDITKHLNEEDEDIKKENDENNDEKDEKDGGVEILDVKVETDGVDIVDVKKDSEDNDDETDDENGEDSEEKNEDETAECSGSDKFKEAKRLNDDANNSLDEKHAGKLSRLDQVIAALKKKKDECAGKRACESLVLAQYPVSRCLTEENFAEFASLSESQKNKVVAYLQDNNFATADAINENWKNGKDYAATEPVWLKLAPKDYKELYEQADESVKKSIKTTADYLLFENMNDIVEFWENSGLAENKRKQLINESFINNMPKVNTQVDEGLGYSVDFIKSVTQMACEYNNK